MNRSDGFFRCPWCIDRTSRESKTELASARAMEVSRSAHVPVGWVRGLSPEASPGVLCAPTAHGRSPRDAGLGPDPPPCWVGTKRPDFGHGLPEPTMPVSTGSRTEEDRLLVGGDRAPGHHGRAHFHRGHTFLADHRFSRRRVGKGRGREPARRRAVRSACTLHIHRDADVTLLSAGVLTSYFMPFQEKRSRAVI